MDTDDKYFLVRIVNGKRVKFWYDKSEIFI